MILVATPAYGGQITAGYFRTAVQLAPDVDFLITENESHITRARNNLVATFMQSDCDTLAFIDADIEIKPADFWKLADMTGVRGAAVAMKTRHGESLSCFTSKNQLTRSQMPREPFSVRYLGSAVLFIDRAVFERLKPLTASYVDPIVGACLEFFSDGVDGDTWLSEDYGFCQLCHAAGIEIVCEPSVIVRHYGSRFWEY